MSVPFDGGQDLRRPRVRAVVVTLDAGPMATPADSLAGLLQGLGHEVVEFRDEVTRTGQRIPPAEVLIIQGGSRPEIWVDAIKRLRAMEAFSNAQILLCVEVAWVAKVDPELAVDDFILTPIDRRELSTRLLHLAWRRSSGTRKLVVRRCGFAFDCVSLQASHRGEPLDLTPSEFRLLRFMTERPETTFSSEELLTRVLRYRPSVGSERNVHAHINNLRRKLGPAAAPLETVRRMGYRWRRREKTGEPEGLGTRSQPGSFPPPGYHRAGEIEERR